MKQKKKQYMLTKTMFGIYVISEFNMLTYMNPFNTVIIIGTYSLCADTLSKIAGQS